MQHISSIAYHQPIQSNQSTPTFASTLTMTLTIILFTILSCFELSFFYLVEIVGFVIVDFSEKRSESKRCFTECHIQ